MLRRFIQPHKIRKMKQIITLLLLLASWSSYGQLNKKFSQIPHYSVGIMTPTDYLVGTHDNGDGTFTDYLYQPSSSIIDTVIGVTYFALDSGLATRVANWHFYNAGHDYTMSAWDFVRASDTTYNNQLALPNKPADGTKCGAKLVYHTDGHYAVVKAQGGQTLNIIGGGQTDTLKLLNEAAIFTYRSADSTWTLESNDLPKTQLYNYLDTRYASLTGATFTGAVIIPKLSTNNQTGTTYTFVLGDAGKTVTASNGSAQTYTVPANGTVAYAVDTYIQVFNEGAGTVTFSPAGGVTIHTKSSDAALNLQSGQSCYLHKTATNTWWIGGGNSN
jgi:hypothetical protein